MFADEYLLNYESLLEGYRNDLFTYHSRIRLQVRIWIYRYYQLFRSKPVCSYPNNEYRTEIITFS